ncbi:MAG: BatD family protein, partial [bacterium]
VRRPSETEEFKLRITLSRETCYVGEPVVLTVTWYLRLDVQDFRFTMPVLGSDAFLFEDPEISPDRSKRYYRIPVGSGEVIAEKSRGILDGVNYATIRFSKVLIPRRPGTHIIPEAVVEAEAITGVRRRRDFFDDFFSDNFFGMRRGRLKKYVTPSNKLNLEVRDLPTAGRPPGFAGHVGEYRISTSATPTTVNIGDPITLRIVLEGPDYLGSVDLPPLTAQEVLVRDFKIPEERADGAVEGSRKVFTQTIRAKREDVTEIPLISLVYFDTKKGRYLTAVSDPIPIEVEATKIVTALDAEGLEPGMAGTPLERWKEGIAYNYEGPDLLVPQELGLSPLTGSAGWLAALIVPPALYALILTGVMVSRRRMSDPDAMRARGALKRLRTRLTALRKDRGLSQAAICQGVMEALREYLGDKLRRTGATLTAGEAGQLLKERSVDQGVIDALTEVLTSCEAGSYAGDLSSTGDRESLIRRVREAAERLEMQL